MTASSPSPPLPSPLGRVKPTARVLLLATSLLLAPLHFGNNNNIDGPASFSFSFSSSSPSSPPCSGGNTRAHGLAAAQLYSSGSNTAGADYAVRMSGTAQYLEVTGMGVDLAGKSFTLEIWVKRARGATEEVLFSQGTGVTGQGLQFGFLSDDKMRFSFWNDDDCDNVYNAFDAGSGAVVEQWTHWAATYEARRKTILN